MGEVVQLIASPVCQETVNELVALLQEARAGELVGLAYVAMHPGQVYTANVVGKAEKSPVFTLGAIQTLTAYLLTLVTPK